MKKSWKKRTLASLLLGAIMVSSCAFATEINPVVTANVNGDSLDVVARYENAGSNADMWLFTAIYDENGSMARVHFEECIAQGGMLASAAKEYSYAISGGETAKVFLWNNGIIIPYARVTNSATAINSTDDFEVASAPVTEFVLPEGYVWDSNNKIRSTDPEDGHEYVLHPGKISQTNTGSMSIPGIAEYQTMTTAADGITYKVSNAASLLGAVSLGNAYLGGGINDKENTSLCIQPRLMKPYQKAYVSADFEPVAGGEVEISFRINCKETPAVYAAGGYNDLGTIKSSDGKTIVKLINLYYRTKLMPYANISNADINVDTYKIGDVKNKWSAFKFVINMDNKTYKAYQDGVQLSMTYDYDKDGTAEVVSDIPFADLNANDVSSIYFSGIDGSINAQDGLIYVDDISVKNGVYTRDITAIGATKEEVGEISTGQVTQVDLGE